MSVVVFLINKNIISVSADSQTTREEEVYDCNACKIFPLNNRMALFAMGDARMATRLFNLLDGNRNKDRMFLSCEDFVKKIERNMRTVMERRASGDSIRIVLGCCGLTDKTPQCGVVKIDSTNIESPIKSNIYSLPDEDELYGNVINPGDLPYELCIAILGEVVSVHPEHFSLEDLVEMYSQTVLEISERSRYVSPPVRYWAYDIDKDQAVSNLFD